MALSNGGIRMSLEPLGGPGERNYLCICGHEAGAHCTEAASEDSERGWRPAEETKYGLGSCGRTGDGSFCTCGEFDLRYSLRKV